MKAFLLFSQILLFTLISPAWAQSQRVIEIPTRPGVTQRFLLLEAQKPKAAVILLPGGEDGKGFIGLSSNGSFSGEGEKGNFLLRARQMFASAGLLVAIVDAPSDRRKPPYLGGFRTKPEHAADIKEVIAWLKKQAGVPVWLVGNCTGTYSAASVAIRLPPGEGGPDGVVLTSTVLTNESGIPGVPDMRLGKITVPALVVHHRSDECKYCSYAETPKLMNALSSAPRKELLTFEGGKTQGDPCDALGFHGFNGIEKKVADRISLWITQNTQNYTKHGE